MKRSHLVTLVILAVLFLDQALKFYIKLNFEYNQDVPLFGLEWARLHFVENEGMAFGITFGWEYGKLLLSTFRIIMVGGLIWYIRHLIALKAPLGLILSTGLITAGALGNIIDSVIYGVLFTQSPYHGGLAQFAGGDIPGYGTLLHGKVVDMLYFPMKYIDMPEWMPFWSGETVLFFSPIFNIADAAITCGVFSILIFQRDFFKEEETVPPAATEGYMVGEDVAPVYTEADGHVVSDMLYHEDEQTPDETTDHNPEKAD